MAKIYVASSWRNQEQPSVVARLRGAGHEVYDFRHPGNPIMANGFKWGEVDPEWMSWSAAGYREHLQSPIAQLGFENDFEAMQWADYCVLVLPCGRSAHLELGWMAGAGKKTIILTRDGEEPELMALLAGRICISMDEVIEALKEHEDKVQWAGGWGFFDVHSRWHEQYVLESQARAAMEES